jgi:hypothetical protein
MNLQKRHSKLLDIRHLALMVILMLFNGCLLTLHPEIQRQPEIIDEYSIAVLNNDVNAGLQITENLNIGFNPSFTKTKNVFYKENYSFGMDAMLSGGFINGIVATGLFYYNDNSKLGIKVAPCLIGEYVGTRQYNAEIYSCFEYGLILEFDVNCITFWMMKNRGVMVVTGMVIEDKGMFDNIIFPINYYRKTRSMYGINYSFGGESKKKFSLFANIGFESCDHPDTQDNIFSKYYSVSFGISSIVDNFDFSRLF